MKTSFWRRWCNSLRNDKPVGPGSRARPRRRPLSLHTLEDRVTPSLTPQMVLDINTITLSSSPSQMVAVGSINYFTANDGVHGVELWRSDGTAAGTVLVKDIYPGSASSGPGYLTNVNGTLFFAASDGTTGAELWKSDGTATGTTLVKDIYPGHWYYGYPNSSFPRNLANVNGTLFFAADDGAHGRELWKSDGTAIGTTLVKDVLPGGSYSYYGYYYLNSSDPGNLTNVNGTLFFTAVDYPAVPGSTVPKLWKSDGTAAGTVPVNPGGTSSFPRNLTNVNGTLFFSAYDSTTGAELWKSDGTAAGTILVKDIYSYANVSSSPGNLTNVNGTLFFTADNGPNGRELWKSDGTVAGTVLVKDINPGWYGSFFDTTNTYTTTYLANVNGTLIFTAWNSTTGIELWKSDGTANGTVLVKDILPGSLSSQPRDLTVVGGTLFFSSSGGVSSRKLWQSDGTSAGTAAVTDLPSSSLTNVNGTLFFSADNGLHGWELWKLIDDGVDIPQISINDVSKLEGRNGFTLFVFTVSLSIPSAVPVTVRYATVDGTARAGEDYEAASGTLTFAPGETTKTITIKVKGDRAREANETFYLDLFGNSSNSLLLDGRGVGTIVNDD